MKLQFNESTMSKVQTGTPFILDDECYLVAPTYSPNNIAVEIARDTEVWLMETLVCNNTGFVYVYIPQVGYILPINKLLIKDQ